MVGTHLDKTTDAKGSFGVRNQMRRRRKEKAATRCLQSLREPNPLHLSKRSYAGIL
jgi:hypothetical protein